MDPAELRVLREDGELLALDKPAGMHTAPLARQTAGGAADPRGADTLLEAVIARFPEVARVSGMKPAEPGLLHRLDRETSGIVIVARTNAAFAELRRQFEADEVTKVYLAVCAWTGPADQSPRPGARIAITSRFAPWGPGRRSVRVVPRDERRQRILANASPQTYATEATILRRESAFLLVRCSIKRGFRHQVRAHLSHLGLPIVGDPLYGVPAPPGGQQRMCLHAAEVELAHPATRQRLSIVSEAPPLFEQLLAPSAGDAPQAHGVD